MELDLKDHPHCLAAHQYALDIVAGRIPAGHYTIAACKRQLTDLDRADWAYRFDPVAAERVCRFSGLMPHVKGKWARSKKRIRPEPWQQFCYTTIFGWKRRSDDTRRFREAYICVARKNGKSIMAAVIGNYMLAADGEHGAEVYSGATTEKQAWEVFRPARLMALNNRDFRDAYGISVHAKTLSIDADGSRFEPLIGKPGDGASPSCAIIDEFHEHPDSDQYDTMVTGTGARTQPLILIITTAGSDISGPCYQKNEEIQTILDGNIEDNEKFGIIYHIDTADNWLSEQAIYKANPSVNVTVPLDFFQARQKEGRLHVAKQNAIKTKHFNIWTSAKAGYFNLENWQKCTDNAITYANMQGKAVIGSIDLGSKQDMTAVVYITRDQIGGKTLYQLLTRFYLPEDRILLDGTKKYQHWAAAGHLRTTVGNEIDFQQIIDDIEADLSHFEVGEIAFDPHLATHLAQQISEKGAPMIEFLQRPAYMGEPMDEFAAAIDAGRVIHDNNPIMAWMMGNVINTKPNNKLPFPGKQRPENKIDGPVAAIMAIGRMMADDSDEQYFSDFLSVNQA